VIRNVHALIPARLESARLPRKLLLADTGKPLIVHTLESVLAAGCFKSVRVLTANPSIIEAIKGIPGVAYHLDGKPFHNGTERVADFVVRDWRHYEDGDLFVNVQADEPGLKPRHFDTLINCYADNPAGDVATLCRPIPADERELYSTVKAAVYSSGEVGAFSRSGFFGNEDYSLTGHIGVYAFQKRYLQWYLGSAPSVREEETMLEQNRLFKARHYASTLADYDGISVNTADDYERFCASIRG